MLLVELDATDYQVALDQAKASESAARRPVEEIAGQKLILNEAVRDEAKAEVAVAESNAQMAQSDHDRYVDASTHNAGAISKQQLDNATATWRGALTRRFSRPTGQARPLPRHKSPPPRLSVEGGSRRSGQLWHKPMCTVPR